jgi:hypothetical protein
MKIFYDLSYPTLTMYIHCKSAADYAKVIEKTDSGQEYSTPWDELTADWWHSRDDKERKHFAHMLHRTHKSNSDVIVTLEFADVHNAHEMMGKLEKYFFDYTDGAVTMLKYTKLDVKAE